MINFNHEKYNKIKYPKNRKRRKNFIFSNKNNIPVHDIPLSETKLPVRLINTLESEKILTVGDLMNKNPSELFNIKNIGVQAIKKIKEIIEIYSKKSQNER